jgi:hypothetical protein
VQLTHVLAGLGFAGCLCSFALGCLILLGAGPGEDRE